MKCCNKMWVQDLGQSQSQTIWNANLGRIPGDWLNSCSLFIGTGKEPCWGSGRAESLESSIYLWGVSQPVTARLESAVMLIYNPEKISTARINSCSRPFCKDDEGRFLCPNVSLNYEMGWQQINFLLYSICLNGRNITLLCVRENTKEC